MKNRKSFLKGALCGALAMLLVAGLVSCGLKVNNGNCDITSKTEDKISELQNLIEKHYMGDVKEKNLEDGVYIGYINGLNDPYSVYYNKKENATFEEDFFVRTKDELVPVEVKANNNRSISLRKLIDNENYSDIKWGIKLADCIVGIENGIYTFPYFCSFLIKRYLAKRG